jgi:23S rRNA (guanosine2251-2'-O)-methyltransferase
MARHEAADACEDLPCDVMFWRDWLHEIVRCRGRAVRDDLPLPPSPVWPALTTAELVGRKPDDATFAALPRAPISVVLDDVRSLANVGLIFRICDALRVERLYLCGITGHPAVTTPGHDARPRHVQDRAEREIAKTAVMALPYVPWEYQPSATDVAHGLRQVGYQVVAIEQAHAATPYTRPGIYRPPLCLILGHERAGVGPTALSAADLCVELPVYGMANSLNVAMACALVGYEILRQHAAFGLSPL